MAVTRAQALLYVVGDASVLGLDPLWRGFLNYVHKNEGWRGEGIPWDPSVPIREDGEEGGYAEEMREMGVRGMEEFVARVREMAGTGGEDEDEVDEEAEAGMEVPVFREEE